MTGRLTYIFRHPIKAHGREALASVVLSSGECLPWDRRWAIAHEAARITEGWNSCTNFLRGAKVPQLMAMEASFDEARAEITLSHPQLGTITARPDVALEADRLVAWVAPLIPQDRAQPVNVVRFDGGLTDSDYPTVSILSHASLADLSARMGLDLSIHRFRANLWVDGVEPWAEFGWIGKRLAVGDAVLEVTERIGRCRATSANPVTGEVDADTLAALTTAYGHTDFGVFAKVIQGGSVSVNDEWTLL